MQQISWREILLGDQIPEYVCSVDFIVIRWRQTILSSSLHAEEACCLSKGVRLTSIVGLGRPLICN
jgi:hypothetical protein